MPWLTDPCREGRHSDCRTAACVCACGHRLQAGPVLKPLELAVLRLWAQRLTLPQVAAELNYSVDNVKSHMKNARRRWGVHSTTELMDAAINAGWRIR